MTGIELQITAEDTSSENLRKFLESDDPALVRMGLAMAKGTILPEELYGLVLGLKLWNSNGNIRKTATEILKKDAPDVIEKTKHFKSTTRIKKVSKLLAKSEELKELGFSEACAISPLSNLLLGNVFERRGALSALGHIGDARAIPSILEALESDAIPRDVGAALDNIGDVQGFEELVRLLKSSGHASVDSDMIPRRGSSLYPLRTRVVLAMGNINNEFKYQFVEPLIETLAEPFPEVTTEDHQARQLALRLSVCRSYTIILLGKIGDIRAVEPLISIIESDSDKFWDLFANKSQYRDGARHTSITALGEIGDKRAIGPLIRTLKDIEQGGFAHRSKWTSNAEWAVISLGKIGDRQATIPLIKLLETTMSGSVATALGRIGDNQSVEPLIMALKNDSKEVRSKVAEALGEINDKRAIGPLISALQRPENDEEDESLDSWRQKKETVSVKTTIIEALEKMEANVPAHNLKLPDLMNLIKEGDERAIEPLVERLDNYENCRRIALALKEFGWKPESKELELKYLIALGPPLPSVGDWTEIIKFGDMAVKPLTSLIKSGHYYVGHTDALFKINNAQATEYFTEVIEDSTKEDYLRRSAGEALGYDLETIQSKIEEQKPRWKFESSSQPGKFYVVTMYSASSFSYVGESESHIVPGGLECDCPGFVYRRRCKHVTEVEMTNRKEIIL